MQLLDSRGFIYDVYDLENGRVFKKQKPKFLQYFKHLYWAQHWPLHVERNQRRARKLADRLTDQELIGNPRFESKHSYTQDKVTLYENYIPEHSLEENKRAIDAYIASIYECWKHGFADTVFNFTHNNGFNSRGRSVLIDFNEITFDKAFVLEQIGMRRWLLSWSYRKKLPEGPLKIYYAESMNAALTKEALHRYWKDNPDRI